MGPGSLQVMAWAPYRPGDLGRPVACLTRSAGLRTTLAKTRCTRSSACARLTRMAEADEKQTLHRYLQNTRGVLLWKLDGLSDYDFRRPMTPTGTNLLGLVKQCAGVECGYFGEVMGRPFPGERDLDWH